MANSAAETVIGAVVLAVAGGFLVYAAQTADINFRGSYELVAQFRKADGLSSGADVRVSGVKVGTVRSLSLDRDTFQARAVLAIEQTVRIPDDSAATIASEGLLGGAHIAIQPGGSDFMLEPGEEFAFTQGSVNIMDLIGRAISGGAE
ncbi:MAG: outer membrane lipid asymmetry maintenance protein MlaD [Rhodobacteraceae bacterium]|nr:MAG: outer membrane lipid asymmetry maintenance protein MlaD [Paracoccaceae bacterium]